MFEIDVHVRYHDRRRAFYDFLHRCVAGVGVLGGSASIAGLATMLTQINATGVYVILVAGLLVAFLNAADLVIGFVIKARLHDDLYRRYISLQAKLVRIARPTDDDFRAWKEELLLIERDEPPVYWGVFAQAWNQSVYSLARDKSGILDTTGHGAKFVFRHIWRFHETDFPPVSAKG